MEQRGCAHREALPLCVSPACFCACTQTTHMCMARYEYTVKHVQAHTLTAYLYVLRCIALYTISMNDTKRARLVHNNINAERTLPPPFRAHPRRQLHTIPPNYIRLTLPPSTHAANHSTVHTHIPPNPTQIVHTNTQLYSHPANLQHHTSSL